MTKDDWIVRDRPASFADFAGQEALIRTLTKSIRDDTIDDHIVFFGARGMGRHTLARFYAQALQCSEPLPCGSPCQECPFCEAMKNGMSWTCVELDAGDARFAERVTESIKYVGRGLTSARRDVVLIDHPEIVAAGALERLLKTLERPSHTIFLFVTAELSQLSSAIRSRCASYPLKSLTKKQAYSRLVELCRREKLDYEEAALDLVSAQARYGAASLLHELWEAVEDGQVTIRSARKAFDLNWISDAADCWHALALGKRDEAFTLFHKLSPNLDEALQRWRVFLYQLHAKAVFGPTFNERCSDPAFLHLVSNASGGDILDDDLHALNKKSLEQVLQFWASSDPKGWGSLRQELNAFEVWTQRRGPAEAALLG